MAWIEKEGIPSVGIICEGFDGSAYLVAENEGLPNARIAVYPPPNVLVQSSEEVYEYAEKIIDEVIRLLTESVVEARTVVKRAERVEPREVIFRGDLEEVNDFFRETRRTDGLPIIPPTIEKVERFLKYTDRSPEEVLGIFPPANCEGSVWNVAVNGVMAGCRPEYMPVLLALIEAIAEPRFAVHSYSSSSGWTPLIILNGPIIKELNFNYGAGVLRPERQANITVSRFLKLWLANIAGFVVGETEMATFGRNYIPVLAENEDESPWEPLCVDWGFKSGSNVVTVQSSTGMGDHFLTAGTPIEQLKILADYVASELTLMPTCVAQFGPEVYPVVCLSPIVASTIAQGGYSKSDVKEYLFENARIPANLFEARARTSGLYFTLRKAVESGALPKVFFETEDPNRLVPIVHRPDEFVIPVTGFPNRSRCFIMAQVAIQGLPVSKEIKLPNNWEELLRRA